MKQKQDQGFSLIELMIAVVIVAILVGVALPAYQSSVQKSRRADAKITLERVAAQQERWFTENNSYSNDINDLGGSSGKLESDDGHYSVTMTNVGCSTTVSGRTFHTCFDLTAAPTAGGTQTDDICGDFTLDEVGARGYTGGSGTQRDCW